MIQGNAAVYLWLACLLLLLPLDWLLAAFFAAGFHELCHILALMLLGGSIRNIRICPTGCVIEAGNLGQWQSLCSILAGPAGSLLLFFASAVPPKIGVCGLLQGIYNLLPVLPLDGGRMLRLLLYRFFPEKSERILFWVGRIFCGVLLTWIFALSVGRRLGAFPVFFTFLWLLRLFPRKIPCNAAKIGVQ